MSILKRLDGDHIIQGALTVLGGINDPTISQVKTRLATTEDDVRVAQGEIAELPTVAEVEGMIDAQVPELVIIHTPKNLGRFYASHPTSFFNMDRWVVYDEDDDPIQRGVYYSDNGTPTRITTASAQALQLYIAEGMQHIAWAEAQGTYGTSADYGIESVFQSLGAVSAFIETLAAKQAFIESLFTNQIEVPDGGRIRYFTGKGVQRRAVELANESVSWIDTPDTTPATDEQLRGRIGRLGVGESILINGNFEVPIIVPDTNPVQISNEISHNPAIIRRSNGELRLSHVVYGQRWRKEYVNTGSGWSAGTAMPYDASTYLGKARYIERPDGTLFIFCMDTEHRIRWQRLDDEVWTSPGILDTGAYGDFDIILQKDGRYRLICSNSTSTACVERWYDANLELVAGPTERSFISWNMRLIEKPSGQIVLWAIINDVGLTRRVESGSDYGSPEIIESSIHGWPCDVIQTLDGAEVVYYLKPTTLEIATRKYTDSASDEVLTGYFDNQAVVVAQKNNGTVVVVYEKNSSPFNLFSIERTQYARLGAGIIESGADYDEFGNGLLIQRGVTGTLTSGTVYNFTFPKPFNAVPSFVGSPQSSSGTAVVFCRLGYNVTATGFSVVGAGAPYSWIAVGK